MAKYLGDTKYILFEVKDRIARITFNRPEKRNALHPPMLAELRDALIEADALVDVNVIILEGAGKDFCAGYDLAGAYAGFKDGETPPWDESKYRTINGSIDDDCWNLEQTQKLNLVLFEIHKPVIAKVQGNCMAGGTDLALMCDLIICTGRGQNRLPGNPRQRHPAQSDVDLSRRSPMGQAHHDDRRLPVGPRRRPNRAGTRCSAGRST